jgi:hypothetical protein
MPKSILLTILWDDMHLSMSAYTMYSEEIEEAVDNYGLHNHQVLMFSHLPVETIRQWVWDVFAREPYEIIVENIFY